MSRSIHSTRRELHDLEQWDVADEAQHARQVQRVQEALGRKRRIKTSVERERREPSPPVALPSGVVPIETKDASDFVHFPADASDIRAVLERLPAGVADGLTLIELCLGKEWQDRPESALFDKPTPDPYVGRSGHEWVPGYYSGTCGGHYDLERRVVRLFAYVYAPDAVCCEELTFFLKGRMLSTLVHELAHHHDVTMRTGRGRWLGDHSDKREIYAEGVQHKWVPQHVVPYILEQFPSRCAALLTWVEHYGGIRVDLKELLGDPRITAGENQFHERLFFNMPTAFCSLAEGVISGRTLRETRLGFARELHYFEDYDRALTIIDSLLADDAEDDDAFLLKADIFEHLERYEEACQIATALLNADATDTEAMLILAGCYEGMARWTDLLSIANRLCAIADRRVAPFLILRYRATALAELGDRGRFEQVIGQLRAMPNRSGPRVADRLCRKYPDMMKSE